MSSDFLAAVWGDLAGRELYGEIRLMSGGEVLQRFFADPAKAWDYAAEKTGHGWDAYFGVLPRIRQGGRADDVVDATAVLWADVDAKKFSAVLDVGKFQALTAINNLPFPAQFLVDSGGGYHAYWILDRPIPYERAKAAMIWIARVINGDSVHDKPRILRVPGSLNWKRGEPVPARLLRFDLTRQTRISDLEGAIPPIHEHRRIPPEERVRIDYLPPWLQELIETGSPKGHRSEDCFRAMVWLIRYGRTHAEILDIFRSNPQGIGAKMAEKVDYDGYRWFAYTYDAAEAVA